MMSTTRIERGYDLREIAKRLQCYVPARKGDMREMWAVDAPWHMARVDLRILAQRAAVALGISEIIPTSASDETRDLCERLLVQYAQTHGIKIINRQGDVVG